MLEPGEEIFHNVAHFIGEGVELWVGLFTIGFPRNNGIHSPASCLLADFFRVVAFVSDEVISHVVFSNNFGGCFNIGRKFIFVQG